MINSHDVTDEEIKEAREAWEHIQTTNWYQERPNNVKELYERYPPWKFYIGQHGQPMRAVGVLEMDDGELRLDCVTCLTFTPNRANEGHKPETLTAVERYDEAALTRISLCRVQEPFLDPNGWMCFI